MTIQIKRVYEAPEDSDGTRILVDRLWPRGISKEKGRIDHWFKEISPSNDLRRWYQHDPDKWESFKTKYAAELKAVPDKLEALKALIRSGPVTFLYSSKEEQLNNAVALRDFLTDLEP